MPYRLGGPDSRGEVSRETLSAEVSLQRPGGASGLAWICIATQEGLKHEHSLGPGLGGNEVNGKAEL